MTDIDQEKIRQLDGALLLVLRELLRQRRTTVAAQRLGLSQSAVSHALGRLRRLFDDPLFVRRPHGLEPTPRAIALGPSVDALLASMADVLGVADEFEPSTARHDFRIIAPDHVATVLAPSLLRTFASAAPRSRFSFSQRLDDDALTALGRHEAEVVLGRFRARIPRELVSRRLFQDRYCLIARNGHPGISEPVTVDELRTVDHVRVSVAGDFRTLDIETGRARARPGRTIAAVPRFAMAFPMVSSSDAVAVAPERLAKTLGPAFGIRSHRLPMPTEPIDVLLVHRREPDAATTWLVDLLRRLESETANAVGDDPTTS